MAKVYIDKQVGFDSLGNAIINEERIFEITDLDKLLLADDIESSVLHDDIKRRLQWVIKHKCARVLQRMKQVWTPRLKERGLTIPDNDEDLVNLIVSQEDYKDAQARADEAEKVIMGTAIIFKRAISIIVLP